jgi:hypothetical protein
MSGARNMDTIQHQNDDGEMCTPATARTRARQVKLSHIHYLFGRASHAARIVQDQAKLAGYHIPTSRECTEVEYASPGLGMVHPRIAQITRIEQLVEPTARGRD